MHDVDDYYPQCPEALVVSMARAGDRSAFAELVNRRQSSIRALMRRCCNDGTLADDLAQQVFLQAWQKIHTLKKAGAFGGWLKRLAISVWLQHQRRNDALHGADELAGHESAGGEPTDVAMDLDRALATLQDRVRLSVVLSYQEGMTHEEIAELTDTPLGTVKSHINRGAQKLRQLLAAYGDEHGTEKTQ